jgi:hypothetical protein
MYGQHPSSDRAWYQSSMSMMCYNSRAHSNPMNTANPQHKLAHCLIMECPKVLKQRGVSHYGLAIYFKEYLEAKEELWKPKYFTMQKYIFKKSSK